jgi:hypothetical protein
VPARQRTVLVAGFPAAGAAAEAAAAVVTAFGDDLCDVAVGVRQPDGGVRFVEATGLATAPVVAGRAGPLGAVGPTGSLDARLRAAGVPSERRQELERALSQHDAFAVVDVDSSVADRAHKLLVAFGAQEVQRVEA